MNRLMVKAAMTYIGRGWQVLPLFGLDEHGCRCGRQHCGSPGKHPHSYLAPSGVKDATLDEDVVRSWFERDPSINIGIRTGAVSGIVVVDIDVDHGGLESFAELDDRYGRHDPTVLAITGSQGLHFYHAHPGDEVRNSAGTIGPGIDIRGENGFVVAPPSRHYSGNVYSWDGEGHPAKRPPTPLPRWILEWSRTRPVSTGVRMTLTIPGEIEPIPDGQRNVALASHAGRLRARGADEASIRAHLLALNARACNPPLPEREVVAIARSISRYPAGTEMHG